MNNFELELVAPGEEEECVGKGTIASDQVWMWGFALLADTRTSIFHLWSSYCGLEFGMGNFLPSHKGEVKMSVPKPKQQVECVSVKRRTHAAS